VPVAGRIFWLPVLADLLWLHAAKALRRAGAERKDIFRMKKENDYAYRQLRYPGGAPDYPCSLRFTTCLPLVLVWPRLNA